MTTRLSHRIVDDRTASRQLVVDDIGPLLGGVIDTAHAVGTATVAEIVGHGHSNTGAACRRRIVLEVHLDRLRAIQHQRGHRDGGLALGFGRQVIVLHVVPVEVHRLQCGHIEAQCRGCVLRYRLGGSGRAPPVAHHLSHGRGGAARQDMIAVLELGQHDIVGIALTPGGGQERADGGTALQGGSSLSTIIQRLDLLAITIQQRLECLGGIFGTVVSMVAITQHSRDTVITGHDDKALLPITGVEHIICRLTGRRITQAWRPQCQFQTRTRKRPACHKTNGNRLSLILVDGHGMNSAEHRQAHQKRQKSTPFHNYMN